MTGRPTRATVTADAGPAERAGRMAVPEPSSSSRSVSRVYGEEVEVYALREVSLQIFPGEFMSIVGPSGSGKSTMLGLLGVLDLPDLGHDPRRRTGREHPRRPHPLASSGATPSASSSSSSTSSPT